jgi:arsenite methyltransferase
MRNRARDNAIRAGLAGRVDVRPGLAEDLPVGPDSIDVVITNGVINLTTDKVRAFAEIRRALRPGGVLHLADVLLNVDLHEQERMDPRLWSG